MLNLIDNYLNGTTMYRLIVYYLVALLLVASWFGFLGVIPYNPFAILGSALFMSSVAYLVNVLFSKTFETPANIESALITGLILSLIISPPAVGSFVNALPFLIWAPVLAMATKYILTWRKKHVFNPAAVAVVITEASLGLSATWWVGTQSMMIFVLLGGLLLVRKMRRGAMVLSFILSALVVMLSVGVMKGTDITSSFSRTIFQTPILFFAFVMLTEPLTTPARKWGRVCYGTFVGLLFAPAVHIWSVYSTPELALLVGNLFTLFVSPSGKLMGVLKEKILVATNTYDFVFNVNRRICFVSGQYMSWTQGTGPTDDRGNRRYFTIASSPTEHDLRVGIKFYPKSSTFKSNLLAMNVGDSIAVTELSGDFVLPRNEKKKLIFLAGGIGVTPFRSMIKYMIDTKKFRDTIMVYSNNTIDDIAYTDMLDEAYELFGLRTVYTLTDMKSLPPLWKGRTGYINARMIAEEIPDFRERIFYISGPHVFVEGSEKTLRSLGVPSSCIKTDYFPGF